MPDERDDDDLPGGQPPVSPPAAAPVSPPPPPPDEPDPAAPAVLPVPAKKHTHTSRLTRIAAELGFSQDDLDNNPSEVIWEEVHRIQQLQASSRPASASPATVVESDDLDFGEHEDPDTGARRKYTEKDFHPALVKVMREQAEKNKALKAALSKVDQLEARERDRASRRFDSYVDRAFAALGTAYEAIYGKGPITGLTDTAAKQRRVVVATFARLDAEKDDEESILRKVAATAATLHPLPASPPPVPPPPTPKPEANGHVNRLANGRYTAEEWNEGALLAPTARNGAPEERSDFAAKRQLAAQMKAAGLDPGPIGDGDDDEDLPG